MVLSRERRFANHHHAKTEGFRSNAGERFRGARNVNWKGGVTPERRLLKSSPEYKAWAQAVYLRDRFICQLCGIKCKRPEAHHIKPIRERLDLMMVVDNGITLCGACHELTYGKEGEFEARFAAIVANGVNSGDARPERSEGNPEPSRGGNTAEGVETRSRAYTTDLTRFQKQEVPCAHCGALLVRHPYRVRTQKRHFCNQKCKAEWQRTGYKGQGSTKVQVPCAGCGKLLWRIPARLEKHPAACCSTRCGGKIGASRRWHGGNAPTSAPPERDDIVRPAP